MKNYLFFALLASLFFQVSALDTQYLGRQNKLQQPIITKPISPTSEKSLFHQAQTHKNFFYAGAAGAFLTATGIAAYLYYTRAPKQKNTSNTKKNSNNNSETFLVNDNNDNATDPTVDLSFSSKSDTESEDEDLFKKEDNDNSENNEKKQQSTEISDLEKILKEHHPIEELVQLMKNLETKEQATIYQTLSNDCNGKNNFFAIGQRTCTYQESLEGIKDVFQALTNLLKRLTVKQQKNILNAEVVASLSNTIQTLVQNFKLSANIKNINAIFPLLEHCYSISKLKEITPECDEYTQSKKTVSFISTPEEFQDLDQNEIQTLEEHLKTIDEKKKFNKDTIIKSLREIKKQPPTAIFQELNKNFKTITKILHRYAQIAEGKEIITELVSVLATLSTEQQNQFLSGQTTFTSNNKLALPYNMQIEMVEPLFSYLRKNHNTLCSEHDYGYSEEYDELLRKKFEKEVPNTKLTEEDIRKGRLDIVHQLKLYPYPKNCRTILPFLGELINQLKENKINLDLKKINELNELVEILISIDRKATLDFTTSTVYSDHNIDTCSQTLGKYFTSNLDLHANTTYGKKYAQHFGYEKQYTSARTASLKIFEYLLDQNIELTDEMNYHAYLGANFELIDLNSKEDLPIKIWIKTYKKSVEHKTGLLKALDMNNISNVDYCQNYLSNLLKDTIEILTIIISLTIKDNNSKKQDNVLPPEWIDEYRQIIETLIVSISFYSGTLKTARSMAINLFSPSTQQQHKDGPKKTRAHFLIGEALLKCLLKSNDMASIEKLTKKLNDKKIYPKDKQKIAELLKEYPNTEAQTAAHLFETTENRHINTLYSSLEEIYNNIQENNSPTAVCEVLNRFEEILDLIKKTNNFDAQINLFKITKWAVDKFSKTKNEDEDSDEDLDFDDEDDGSEQLFITAQNIQAYYKQLSVELLPHLYNNLEQIKQKTEAKKPLSSTEQALLTIAIESPKKTIRYIQKTKHRLQKDQKEKGLIPNRYPHETIKKLDVLYKLYEASSAPKKAMGIKMLQRIFTTFDNIEDFVALVKTEVEIIQNNNIFTTLFPNHIALLNQFDENIDTAPIGYEEEIQEQIKKDCHPIAIFCNQRTAPKEKTNKEIACDLAAKNPCTITISGTNYEIK